MWSWRQECFKDISELFKMKQGWAKYLIEYVSNQPGSKNCQNKKVQAKRLDIPGYLWYFKKVYISESNENRTDWEK